MVESGKHTEVFKDITKYKKHIIVEKPMALILQDADDMIRISDENGTKLFVAKKNRFSKPVQLLRKALEKGRFGELILGTTYIPKNVFGRGHEEYIKNILNSIKKYCGISRRY